MKYRRQHRDLELFLLSLFGALLVLAAAMLLKFLLKKAEVRNKNVIEIPRALTKPLTADEIVERTHR